MSRSSWCVAFWFLYSCADALQAVQSNAYGLLQRHIQPLPKTRELHGFEHRPVTAYPRWKSKVEELPQTRRRDRPSIGIVNLCSQYNPLPDQPCEQSTLLSQAFESMKLVPLQVFMDTFTRDNDATCVTRGNVPRQNLRTFIDSVSSK